MTSTAGAAGSRETVYAAIELSKKTWVLGIAHPDRDRPSIHRVCGGNFAELVGRLRVAARNNRRILVCYEAGYDGFWLARALAKIGIECRVLDPASIQVNRRARRVKTDRIDVLALLRALIATDRGERHICAIVRVPSVEEEDARRSHRERQRLVRERTGHINRIKGLLFAQGIRDIKPKLRRTRIDFAGLETAEGHQLPDRLRRELEGTYQPKPVKRVEIRERLQYGPGYLLLWVAVLFVIFQTPLILSRLWKSSHSLDLPLKLSWTEAASPTCVTEINRPTMPLLGGAAHPSKLSEIRFLCRRPSASMKKIQASS